MKCSALALALLLATLTPTLLGATSPQPVSIVVGSQHGSHERGTAVFTRRDDELIVDVRMTGIPPDTASQLVHLHRGPCDRLSLHDAIDLEPLVAGHSRTMLRGVDAKRALDGGTYYVSVHKFLANLTLHVACGGPVRMF